MFNCTCTVIAGDYLEEFVQVCRRKESTDQLLGKSVLDAHKDTGKGNGDPPLKCPLRKLLATMAIKPADPTTRLM